MVHSSQHYRDFTPLIYDSKLKAWKVLRRGSASSWKWMAHVIDPNLGCEGDRVHHLEDSTDESQKLRRKLERWILQSSWIWILTPICAASTERIYAHDAIWLNWSCTEEKEELGKSNRHHRSRQWASWQCYWTRKQLCWNEERWSSWLRIWRPDKILQKASSTNDTTTKHAKKA